MPATKEAPVTLIKLKNILFATDFSPASLAGLPYVAVLAHGYGSKVYLTHVVMPEAYALLPSESTASALGRLERDARERLDEISQSRLLSGIPHDPLVVRGSLTLALTRTINRHDIDLVVVGTNGRHGLSRFLLGSVAENIFRHAPCPVLTVAPHSHRVQATKEIGFRHVLFPTDLSGNGSAAARYAMSLAAEYSARLTVLHVSPDPIFIASPLTRKVEEKMRKLMAAESEPWCDAEYRVEHGEPAKAILKVAKEELTDLIVLSVREAPALATHLQTNVAYRVAAGAGCPVLTVPR